VGREKGGPRFSYALSASHKEVGKKRRPGRAQGNRGRKREKGKRDKRERDLSQPQQRIIIKIDLISILR